MILSEAQFKMHADKLQVIINKQMGNPVLKSFHSLAKTTKTKFNKLLNDYINTCQSIDHMCQEFCDICQEDIFNEEFNPEEYRNLSENTDHTLLLTEEQRENLSKVDESSGYD
jgi:hypothetical protein